MNLEVRRALRQGQCEMGCREGPSISLVHHWLWEPALPGNWPQHGLGRASALAEKRQTLDSLQTFTATARVSTRRDATGTLKGD